MQREFCAFLVEGDINLPRTSDVVGSSDLEIIAWVARSGFGHNVHDPAFRSKPIRNVLVLCHLPVSN
jgi:hypothetical protein